MFFVCFIDKRGSHKWRGWSDENQFFHPNHLIPLRRQKKLFSQYQISNDGIQD